MFDARPNMETKLKQNWTILKVEQTKMQVGHQDVVKTSDECAGFERIITTPAEILAKTFPLNERLFKIHQSSYPVTIESQFRGCLKAINVTMDKFYSHARYQNFDAFQLKDNHSQTFEKVIEGQLLVKQRHPLERLVECLRVPFLARILQQRSGETKQECTANCHTENSK